MSSRVDYEAELAVVIKKKCKDVSIHTAHDYICLLYTSGVIKVKDSSKLLGFLSSRFFGFPSDRLRLIGVIGDKGKTTVVHMLEGILTMGGLEVGFCSSLVNKAGDYYSPPLVDEPVSYTHLDVYKRQL